MESAKPPSDPESAGGQPPALLATTVATVAAVAVTTAVAAAVMGTHDGVNDDEEEKAAEVAMPTATATTTTTELAQQQPRPPRPFPVGLRRLRDRLQMREDCLQLDVNGIQQEIVDLNVQRLVLNTKRSVKRRLLLQKSVEVVVEYFGAFQHGWILEAATTDQHIAELQATLSRSRSFSMMRSPRQDREQAAFLRERQRLLMDRQQHFVATALDPTMVFGPQDDDRNAFVHQWKKYSEQHRVPRLTLTCMTCHGSADEPIVIALGTFSGTLTYKALQEKYPRGLSNPQLMKRLVGAAIQYPSREIFYFSNTGLITRYDRGLDYVCAFASLLSSLEDVSSVLHDTRLWDNGGGARTRDLEQAAATSVVAQGADSVLMETQTNSGT